MADTFRPRRPGFPIDPRNPSFVGLSLVPDGVERVWSQGEVIEGPTPFDADFETYDWDKPLTFERTLTVKQLQAMLDLFPDRQTIPEINATLQDLDHLIDL